MESKVAYAILRTVDEKPFHIFFSLFFQSLLIQRLEMRDILCSVTVSLAFHIAIVDFVSYWNGMEYNRSTQQPTILFFIHLLLRSLSISRLAGNVPIAAFGFMNDDVDDASLDLKSNIRVLITAFFFCWNISSAILLSTHISSFRMCAINEIKTAKWFLLLLSQYIILFPCILDLKKSIIHCIMPF